MEKRKSQVTIFILVGVLIAGIVGAFVYLNYSSGREKLSKEEYIKKGIEPSVSNIQKFMIDCLKDSSTNALELIGIQGGYYKKQDLSYDIQGAFIPYYFYKGQILMPSKETIEKELSSYVDESLKICLNSIQFKNYELIYPFPSTKTDILKKRVIFTTELPTTINNKGKSTQFKLQEHPVTIDSYLYEILEVSRYITDSHNEDPKLMCINCITEMAEERELYVDFIAFEKDTTLVMLLENSTSSEPYLFEFLNKY